MSAHIQPPPTSTQGTPPTLPTGRKPSRFSKDDFRRFWRWYRAGLGQAVLTGVIVAIIVVSAAGGIGGKSRASSQAQTNATNTPAKPRATATPQAAKTVLHVKGNGDKSTATFTVKDTWEIRFSCSGVASGLGSAPLFIIIYQASGDLPPDDVTYNCP